MGSQMSKRERYRGVKGKGRWWWILLFLMGLGAYYYSPLITGSSPRPHKPRGPFPVDRVLVDPIPAGKARASRLDGVLVWLEGTLKREKKTRGGTLLLWIDDFKVVAYPFLARDLDGSLLKPGTRVKVVGVLRNHPRYGWEVILRRPSDLGPVPPAS